MTTESSKGTVLIAEDEDKNRKLLTILCRNEGYEPLTAENGREAVDIAVDKIPDIILMDLMMPEMDGFEATKKLKDNDATSHIPIIILTALENQEDKHKGIRLGANDYLTKPVDPRELILRMENNIKLKKYSDFLENHKSILEKEVARQTKELQAAFEKLEKAHKSVKSAYIDTIYRLILASEYKDTETGRHIKRISYYCEELALALGMNEEFVEAIYYASPMHDVGKVAIPDLILLKRGRLTADECKIMQTHTTIGGDILKGADSYFLKMGEKIARTHHERWDGSGYPNRLKGEEIPMSGRITFIADIYDALRSLRPYKPALPHDVVMQIMLEGDDRTQPEHFNPKILAAFEKIADKFKDIYDHLAD